MSRMAKLFFFVVCSLYAISMLVSANKTFVFRAYFINIIFFCWYCCCRYSLSVCISAEKEVDRRFVAFNAFQTQDASARRN